MASLSSILGGNSGIKSVQRGVININYGAASATATISPVDINKAELRYLGSFTGVSELVNTMFAKIALTSSSTVAATRRASGGVGSYVVIGFEVTEYY